MKRENKEKRDRMARVCRAVTEIAKMHKLIMRLQSCVGNAGVLLSTRTLGAMAAQSSKHAIRPNAGPLVLARAVPDRNKI
jgi:hypothetical protein